MPEVPPAAMEPPVPEAIAAVAVPELTEVTTLPPESSTLTTGWVPRWRGRPSGRAGDRGAGGGFDRHRRLGAERHAVVEGSVPMTSWVAAPGGQDEGLRDAVVELVP